MIGHRFTCETADKKASFNAPLSPIDKGVEFAADGPNVKNKFRTIYQVYDRNWVTSQAAGNFPAKSPSEKRFEKDTTKGCAIEYDSPGGFDVCRGAGKRIVTSECGTDNAGNAVRIFKEPSLDGCNEATCGSRFVRQKPLSCLAACTDKANNEGKELRRAFCRAATDTKCSKAKASDPDLFPHRCSCELLKKKGALAADGEIETVPYEEPVGNEALDPALFVDDALQQRLNTPGDVVSMQGDEYPPIDSCGE